MFDQMFMADANTFRYYKLEAVSSVSSPWVVNEIKYVSGSVMHPTVSMTSGSSPPPLVVTASSNTGGYDPYRAFDNTIGGNNKWISGNGDNLPSITIDFGITGLISATAIAITIEDVATAPASFAVKASNDGALWLTKAVVVSPGWSAANETRTFTFTS